MKVNYISLGNNCEVGMLLARHGYDNSSFFRYTYSDIDSTINIIEKRAKDIFDFDNLIPIQDDMVRDTKFNISFHSKAKSALDQESKRYFLETEDKLSEYFKEEKSKIEYLWNKWIDQIKNGDRNIYFIKDNNYINKEKIVRLINAIRELGDNNFKIIYLCLRKWEDASSELNGIDEVQVEYLDYYAPDRDVTKVDFLNYYKILKKIGFFGSGVTIQMFLEFMNENEFNYSVHISPQKKFIYFEIPKTACSTIKGTLIKNENDAENIDLSKIHDKSQSPFLTPRQFGYENFINALSDDDYIKFTFVRNPVTRVLSAYLSKFTWKSSEKVEFCKRKGIDEDRDVTFEDFIEGLTRDIPYDMNPHWRPQVNQTFGDMVNFDFIGKFENLEQDLHYITNKIYHTDVIYDVREKFAKQNVTKSSSKVDQYYNDDLFRKVNHIYRNDFEKFSYENPNV